MNILITHWKQFRKFLPNLNRLRIYRRTIILKTFITINLWSYIHFNSKSFIFVIRFIFWATLIVVGNNCPRSFFWNVIFASVKWRRAQMHSKQKMTNSCLDLKRNKFNASETLEIFQNANRYCISEYIWIKSSSWAVARELYFWSFYRFDNISVNRYFVGTHC